jgi:hypothetical protein
MSSQAFGSDMDQTIPFWTAQLGTAQAAVFRVTNEQDREVSTLHLSACRPVPLLMLSTSANDAKLLTLRSVGGRKPGQKFIYVLEQGMYAPESIFTKLTLALTIVFC